MSLVYAIDCAGSRFSMLSVLTIIQAVVAALLSLCILLQHRASGLTSTFGGSGAIEVQRRGAERVLFQLTIVLCALFFALTIVRWYIPA